MPRSARVDIENVWYHIVARGQRREPLFLSDKDRRRYLDEIAGSLQRNDGNLGAYCLMTNHVHLLIHRGTKSLGGIFLRAHGRYGRYFNRTHHHVGYVFQGRFKSFMILDDDYLGTLLRYIHLNPVKAGLVRKSSAFRWSSDRYYRFHPQDKDWPDIMVRVPGFEGRSGSSLFRQLLAQEEELEVPTFKQYVGVPTDLKKRDRRTRRGVLPKRQKRGQVTLSERLHELGTKMHIDIKMLLSSSRLRKIAGVRQKLMTQLYREGYTPSRIAELFDRTPAAVIHAYERLAK